MIFFIWRSITQRILIAKQRDSEKILNLKTKNVKKFKIKKKKNAKICCKKIDARSHSDN
jgi:hypothetical protein